MYWDTEDRERYLSLLADALARFGWTCLTYCLMGNHYHLVIQPQEANLPDGMRWLNCEYARWFNRKRERKGHLFEKRYWSRIIRDEADLMGVARYVALNPVKDGFCSVASDWRWSGHRALLGLDPAGVVTVETLLACFDDDPVGARGGYAAFVAGRPVKGVDPRLRTILADRDRDAAIALAFATGYSVPEIAQVLGCHPKTVRRRLTT